LFLEINANFLSNFFIKYKYIYISLGIPGQTAPPNQAEKQRKSKKKETMLGLLFWLKIWKCFQVLIEAKHFQIFNQNNKVIIDQVIRICNLSSRPQILILSDLSLWLIDFTTPFHMRRVYPPFVNLKHVLAHSFFLVGVRSLSLLRSRCKNHALILYT
jgi:hypothetical protein